MTVSSEPARHSHGPACGIELHYALVTLPFDVIDASRRRMPVGDPWRHVSILVLFQHLTGPLTVRNLSASQARQDEPSVPSAL